MNSLSRDEIIVGVLVNMIHCYSCCTNTGAILGVVSASPAHVTVPHGGSTLLTCVAKSSHDTHYEWFKDGTPISENGKSFN